MPLIYIYRGVTGPSRTLTCQVESEDPAFIVDPRACSETERPREFLRTRQHSASGHRVYASAEHPFPKNVTLGWAAPSSFTVESDHDPKSSTWTIVIAGNGHRIVRPLPFLGLNTPTVALLLNQVTLRMLRATHPRIRMR